MSRPPVYLDYHATTPVDRRVLDRMLPYFTETFGNPASSTHQWGWKAQEAVENARREALGKILDARQTEDLLDTLMKRGWLKKTTTQTKGRPRHRWEVNPALHLDFLNNDNGGSLNAE